MTAFADSALNYVDLDGGPWGSFRLIVGGKDVTYFRGIPAQIASYQLTEPFSYGPAEFALPSLTQFEVDAWGTGALKWMGNGKPVKLIQVDADGVKVRTVWRGFITLPEVSAAGVLLHCDGEASGRLAMRVKLPDLFAFKKHVGTFIYDAFSHCHLSLAPYLGGKIGAETFARGSSGSMLDYVNSLLAATIDTDGSQYTVRHRETQGDYHLELKDTDTIDYTVFLGAHGVELDVSDDLTERPNTIYGQGTSPNGLVWVNGRYPGLKQGEAPDYPMADDSAFGAGTTDADTVTGDGVTAMIRKLIGMGYIDRRDFPGGFDADVTGAIKDLQDDAGLTQSGNMNPATWDALYDLDATGFSLRNAFVHPLAEATEVRKWWRTSNGSLLRKNANFDGSVPQVDLYVDHGAGVEKSRAKRWSKGVLNRSVNRKNWAGTLTLSSDVFAGDYVHGDPATLVSRLDIKAGDNIKVRHFDVATLFHVSIVNVSSDLSVTLGVDTKARDAATLGEVIARRIESRSHPARAWLQQHRTDANVSQVQFSEVGGLVFNTVSCPANEWTVFPVVAGQAGNVSRVRVKTTDAAAAFSLAIFAEKVGPAWLRHHVGNPLEGASLDDIALNHGGSGYTSAPTVSFSGGGGSGAAATATVTDGHVSSLEMTDAGGGYAAPPTISFSGGGGSGATASASVSPEDKWSNSKLTNAIDHDRVLLGAWGAADQPCGYMPGSYTSRRNGQLTGDPATGLFIDDGGFDYHTFAQPVVYVAIYPDRDTKIHPQRVLWDVLDNGV